ncbi:MAG: hypothetical protein ABH875_03840 [Candidatus Omnitrophota bacterium]
MKKITALLIFITLFIYVYGDAQQSTGWRTMLTTAGSSADVKNESSEEDSEVSVVYREAVSLYWDSRYNESRAKFEQVQKMFPGYARTKYYLGRLDDKLSAGYKSREEVARTNDMAVKKTVEAREMKLHEEVLRSKLESEIRAKEEASRKARMESDRDAALKAAGELEAKRAGEEADSKAKIERDRKAAKKRSAYRVAAQQNFSPKRASEESAEEKAKIELAKKAREEAARKAKVEADRAAARKAAEELEAKRAGEEADAKAMAERDRKAADYRPERPVQSTGAANIKEPGKVSAAEKPEMVKVKIEISQQIIDRQMTAYKGNLKEIVKEADKNLKKIDGELKGQESGEAVTNHIKAADAYYAEGKIEEAKAEFKAAMVAASTPAMKKSIKEKERALDKKAKEMELKTRQEARAKKDAAKKAKLEAAKKAKEEAARLKAESAERKATKKIAQNVKRENKPGPVIAIPAKTATPAGAMQITSSQTKVSEDEVSLVYRDAVNLYWDSRYTEAKAKFDQVQSMLPGYARTSYYIERLKGKLGR